MIDWMRVDAHLQDNAKLHRLQVLALRQKRPELYLIALSIWVNVMGANRCAGADGALSEVESDPLYLGRHAVFIGCPVEVVEEAFRLMQEVRLVAPQGKGVRMCGWTDEWRSPMTEAERQQAKRDRDAASKGPRNGSVTTVGTPSRDASRDRHEPCHDSSHATVTPPVTPLRQSVRPPSDSQISDSPSSPTPPKEDGPIEDELDSDLRKAGVASTRHRAIAARNLREYPDPAEVLRHACAHARRFGENFAALLATILCDKQQIALMLREAAQKASSAELRAKIEDLVTGMKLKTRAKEAQR